MTRLTARPHPAGTENLAATHGSGVGQRNTEPEMRHKKNREASFEASLPYGSVVPPPADIT